MGFWSLRALRKMPGRLPRKAQLARRPRARDEVLSYTGGPISVLKRGPMPVPKRGPIPVQGAKALGRHPLGCSVGGMLRVMGLFLGGLCGDNTWTY